MLPYLRFISRHPTSLLSAPSFKKMSQSTPKQFASDAKIKDFQRHLESSDRILALLGAGLSASSGLPTFRGAGGMWKNHQATSLATPEAFEDDPGLVWQFYSYRRHMALNAKPNPAHYALAELARKKPNFITLSQNVDGELLFLWLS
jgi:NAD-dependent SIR2 family protein deacetylase